VKFFKKHRKKYVQLNILKSIIEVKELVLIKIGDINEDTSQNGVMTS